MPTPSSMASPCDRTSWRCASVGFFSGSGVAAIKRGSRTRSTSVATRAACPSVREGFMCHRIARWAALDEVAISPARWFMSRRRVKHQGSQGTQIYPPSCPQPPLLLPSAAPLPTMPPCAHQLHPSSPSRVPPWHALPDAQPSTHDPPTRTRPMRIVPLRAKLVARRPPQLAQASPRWRAATAAAI